MNATTGASIPFAAVRDLEGCRSSPRTWVVQPGEALASLARRFGLSVEQLKEWNDLRDDQILIGQTLRLQPLARAGPGPGGEIYQVRPGDTLSQIAAVRGVSIEQIVDWNQGIDPARIRAGQALCMGEARRRTSYRVQPGDALSSIAARYRVSTAEIKRWNAGAARSLLRVGDALTIYTEMPESYSESIGSPNDGRLQNARRLPWNRGYAIRDRDRSWGTDETVTEIASAFDAVRRAHRRAPRVMVHDLSPRGGGPMAGHFSHQSGRDVDIAYFGQGCGPLPCGFVHTTPSGLDVKRQWALLHHWLRRDRVEAIFMDYDLQKPLYHLARRQGATREQLERWFQYPRGRSHPGGIVRHFRKHTDHLHVRFVCHHTDSRCRSLRPLLAPSAPAASEMAP